MITDEDSRIAVPRHRRWKEPLAHRQEVPAGEHQEHPDLRRISGVGPRRKAFDGVEGERGLSKIGSRS